MTAPEPVCRALDALTDAQAELGGLRYSPAARNAMRRIQRAERLLEDHYDLPRWPRLDQRRGAES